MNFEKITPWRNVLPALFIAVGLAGCGSSDTPDTNDGSGIVSNGSFENGPGDWVTSGGFAIASEGANNLMQATISSNSTATDVSLKHPATLEMGNNYTLKFSGKAEPARAVTVGIRANDSAGRTVTLFRTSAMESVNLTPALTEHSVVLSAMAFGGEGELFIDVGTGEGQIGIDDVSLVKGGTIEAFDSGLLSNGDFEGGVADWIGNAANVIDDNGNMVNFANVEAAGQPFDVNLSQVLPIAQGKDFTLSFKARSNVNRTMLAGIGLNEGDFSNDSKEVDLTAEWQTFTLELSSATFGSDNSRVLFDMGAAVGEVYIDDVSLIESTGSATFDDGLLSNGNFEDGVTSWTGNAANVIDNNGSKVNFASIEAAGEPFHVNLSQILPIAQGKDFSLSFKARSNVNRTMLAGIGLNEGDFSNDSKEVSLTAEWQTFTLALSSATFGSDNSRVLFDMGAAVGEVYIDDVSLVESTSSPSTDFDSGLLSNGSFDGGVTGWTGNAANVIDDNGNKVNFANVEAAGEPFHVNLSQILPIAQGKNFTLSFKARSNVNRTMLAGIGLNEGDFSNDSKEVSLTAEWQTFTLALSSATFGSDNSRVLFDMGAAVGEVYIDDVSLVESTSSPSADFDSGLLSNGSFDGGVTGWTGNAANVIDDNGNKVNFANVEAAGEPFHVNLSQILPIAQGKNFTLSFKARSNVNRSMLAGIGLNEGDFSNDSKEVSLTAEWQTFTLALSSATFGSDNSRVLFDMGAAVGEVYIDDVALIEN